MDERRNSASPIRRAATGDDRGVPAVFLDRDGTLSQEVGYVNHIDRLSVFPWAGEAVRKLNRAGLPVIVVTNQSGVGRGYFTEELVRKVHEKLARALAAEGARLDAVYYCPHHPSARLAAYRIDCRCRKPSTGMLEDAAGRFEIDLQASYVVGDSYRDMQLGFNAGVRTVMVLTGYGRGEHEHQRATWTRHPDGVAENLLEAVDGILAELRRGVASPARRREAPRPL